MIGNLQLFKSDYGLAFNEYAVFMTTNPLIKTVSYLLYFSILYHALKGIRLVMKNKQARPVEYHVNNASKNSHWTSRSMGLLGTIIIVFIAVHLSDFWFEYKFGHVPYTKYTETMQSGEIKVEEMPTDYTQSKKKEEYILENTYRVVIVKDLYKEVAEGFKNILIVIVYLISMAAISFHLYHGFKSAFQTLGFNYSNYNGIIHFIGVWGFAIFIPIGFAAMPIYFYFLK
jgi:succinate dehydrogenase / fumarate reductase cytochrome b subunit